MTNCACRNPFHCILPPHILDKLAKSSNATVRNAAVEQMRSAATFRAVRTVANAFPGLVLAASSAAAAARPNRLVYSQGNRTPPWSGLPGTIKRREGQPRVADAAVNEAYNHAGTSFNNAFWEGSQMVDGDGDAVLFRRFTRSLDVVGHELTHGVVQHTSGLIYEAQSGALNEHFADVFGVLVRMYRGKVKANTSSRKAWLIGADLLVPAPTRRALRSLQDPGSAYTNDPDLGSDPQPQHMDRCLDLPVTQAGDWGGVHINSGIPNKAFYLAATSLGGYAWQKAGAV